MAVANPPIGSITAYAGPGPGDNAWETQHGWMLCDGRELNRTVLAFKPLFDIIGSSWGGDGVNSFNLPDLQGLALRGVDGKAKRDPDRDGRQENRPGGHRGNQVGSIQD